MYIMDTIDQVMELHFEIYILAIDFENKTVEIDLGALVQNFFGLNFTWYIWHS